MVRHRLRRRRRPRRLCSITPLVGMAGGPCCAHDEPDSTGAGVSVLGVVEIAGDHLGPWWLRRLPVSQPRIGRMAELPWVRVALDRAVRTGG